MRNLLGVSWAVLALVGGAETARAATYYYASGPALVANQPAVADRPLLNIGRLDVDTSGLPAGETLAGRTVAYNYAGNVYTGHDGIALGYDFALGTGSEGVSYTLTFDAQENLRRWSFDSDWNVGFSDMDLFRVNNAGSRYDHIQTEGLPYPDVVAQRELSARGYDGTAVYQALYCGSWAGAAGGGCDEVGGASSAWGASFIADGGLWIKDDLAAFAALVDATTAAAIDNPPRSYHDIKAIPLPAPLALMLAGIAAIVAVRRSARTA